MRAQAPLAVGWALVALAPFVVSAQARPPRADPVHAYLVEGTVLDAAGAPVAGVVVERMVSATGTVAYSSGAYRETTDTAGAFRFEHHGLGPSVGRTWHLAAHRLGCTDARITVTLVEGTAGGRRADVARGVEMRLAPCP